jgi:serine/threonine protein kinase
MSDEMRCPECGAPLPGHAPLGLCPGCLLKRGLDTSPPPDEIGPGGSFIPPRPEELASQFPELEILEFIGRGGMGIVYKARQRHLDRLVALKILSPDIARDPAFAERFAREARAMAMLSHPHIVTVYDFGPAFPSSEGTGTNRAAHPAPSATGQRPHYYFLMEFVDGLTLRQLLDAGKLAPPEALAIVPQICEALQYAHNKGLVHRDIKPENILIDRSGQVKIADFGIAKLVGRGEKNATLTAAGQIIGTPQYMSPEQIEHPLEVDHRADIYSLGVVFYQMLTGELPIGRFAPPSQKVQIDVRLDEVVLRALEKEPRLRYQQASQVKTEVESIVGTTGPVAAKTAGPAWQSPQMGWGHFVGYLFGITFTSPAAYTAANLSALGFLGSLAALSYLGPAWHRCLGFSGFFGFFGLIGVAHILELHARHKAERRAGNCPSRKGRMWWKLLLGILIALVVLGVLRAFVAEAYVVSGNCLEPELPRGSRILVWKLTSNFTPGDLLAYERERETESNKYVGRYVSGNENEIVVSRNRDGDETVARQHVVGKVISVYWRASSEAIPGLDPWPARNSGSGS